jgi:hypothetical protein
LICFSLFLRHFLLRFLFLFRRAYLPLG